MLEICMVLGAALNVIASTYVYQASIRNSIMHKENLSIAEKISKAVTLMKQLRDLLDEDLFDAGDDRQKEVRH